MSGTHDVVICWTSATNLSLFFFVLVTSPNDPQRTHTKGCNVTRSKNVIRYIVIYLYYIYYIYECMSFATGASTNILAAKMGKPSRSALYGNLLGHDHRPHQIFPKSIPHHRGTIRGSFWGWFKVGLTKHLLRNIQKIRE